MGEWSTPGNRSAAVDKEDHWCAALSRFISEPVQAGSLPYESMRARRACRVGALEVIDQFLIRARESEAANSAQSCFCTGMTFTSRCGMFMQVKEISIAILEGNSPRQGRYRLIGRPSRCARSHVVSNAGKLGMVHVWH